MLRTKYAEQLMYFEKIFASHTMGLRKPEPNKYFMVLDDLKYQPHEVLFLDDNFLIMKAACNFGIDSIHLLSIEQMIYELKK
jgi:putative hydrolase of the HAD superfamily